jgi:hypothetical protein
MHLSPKPAARNPAGYALLLVLVLLMASLVVFGSIMYWVSSNANLIQRNNLFNQSEAAAESATEEVIAYMQRDFMFQSLNVSSTYYESKIPTNWLQRFQFTDTNGVANQTSVYNSATNWISLTGSYAGLNGLGQTSTVTSVASPLNTGFSNLSATVQQQVWFGAIPLFQFAVFDNMDCEINPGAAMTINGRVHSNKNIYATGASAAQLLTFNNEVEAVLDVFMNRMPGDTPRSNNVVFSDTNYPVHHAESLTLPIGITNSPESVHLMLDLPPAAVAAPNLAAYYESNQVYAYNQADLIISNAPSGTNILVFYQNQNCANPLTYVPPDLTNIVTNTKGGVTTSVTNVCYSYVTNVNYYDYREGETVNALQLDVAQLNSWFTNTTDTGGVNYNNSNTSGSTSKSHAINGVYVYNAIRPSATNMPAVRLINGQQLPAAGFTLATPQPIYVKGDYNTTTNGVNFARSLGTTTNNTVPASLMGDAITILSANWDDKNSSNTALGSRNLPVDTTINAACLEGVVPSQKDAHGTFHYSGGVENFLRLLEDWSGNSLNYNGSIVMMFQSQYATNYWPSTGKVYNPPKHRNWGFDVNYNRLNQLPPMSPRVKVMIRNAWKAW